MYYIYIYVYIYIYICICVYIYIYIKSSFQPAQKVQVAPRTAAEGIQSCCFCKGGFSDLCFSPAG